ncbi:glutamine amidotransferase [Marinobacter sp. NP-4(2019)]|uniref:glutamine amidotransferase-related protein n=1 Tax=Marinobacter sp. NP-4(2019) TaxID=2488665 RepID=UPI000FC3E202|nr:glutamine amidotransferase [Marinobacter sp. NP-4(2019)]AZT83849.1 glutamine amidotransferase [Marinobacter sp. NP-4(2019)]
MSLKIGILATGITPDDLIDTYGSYADMFIDLFGQAGYDFDYETFDVRDDVFPDSAESCDAWIITGSKSNVYEKTPWMVRLKNLILEIYSVERPMVGICFGHQIIAEAFGADVNKYPEGWGVGLHTYQLEKAVPELAGLQGQFTLSAMHQDQVVTKPKQAEVIAYSSFCPFAALQYDNRILTLQAHPEFNVDFESRLVRSRRDNPIPLAAADQALEGLNDKSAHTDSLQVARWMASFLQQG